ncbi:MAG: 16S rRNA (guanine(527)-N(7))-methyltransferase RsmG [Bacteroidales bacterium]|nr:16S rRNA (guanine(527)-N(7))-methyltransferase RsmG [Bacteroidales bacterium]MCF8350884.1 16S rRNA (guanine(527)-N(7))-methyltransferase RsmG [Bacteroidales bacterium]MCF8375634.1 16S rRNA (guanine(527)-N(7))-methyltransferase RsmG [Bacteroidales bacterium]MCF8400783.1 16S rRNA (guanine(527)-N(7))-methyltransferase RsmG [Bacteroidales bacterium]
MDIVKKYFPDLTDAQLQKLSTYHDLLLQWNAKVNLVSRKETGHLWERHILHSLGIAKVFGFPAGSKVVDVGTGGGLPGIPLAIVFPDSEFVLVDSIAKKTKAVEDMISRLDLENASATHTRIEKYDGQYDFVVSRAVKALPVFYTWVKDKLRWGISKDRPNGILYLKGGDFQEEIKNLDLRSKIWELSDCFDESFFESKKVVYLYR